ncbi:FGGY family carbohydrate kinase [Amnibacterium sp.]|uniref:xylulokinase n=1 Tax=Amnibacterium sp. TaxID=1872496 RepID=UPI0026265BE6|nr:FGGY family carbohydrate kinase [Amnibacterium sp.]MCU1474472.1 carbohydrate kinase, family protein [Amnibacterium sp.]
MSEPYVIGVDCSTTAVKAIAFDADGQPLAEGRALLARAAPSPGWAEQSAVDWWEATCTALRSLTSSLTDLRAGPPQGIAITHQRESFVCLDGSGKEVRPAILWLDTRAGDQIARFGTPEIHAISGKPPSTTPSLYKLIWLGENEPETLAATAMVADTHAYLVWRLTGRWATSAASADPMSLLDMSSFTWSDRLLDLAGLSSGRVPDLVAPGSVMSTVSPEASAQTGLPVGLPVVAGGGDGQCAGLGAAALEPNHAYLSLGTSLTIGVQSGEYSVSPNYRTLASPVAGSYTLEALVASGMLSLAWLREQVRGLPDSVEGVETLTRMARTSRPGSRGLLFLPYLTSAETPYWDSTARAAFVGLGDYHDLGDMAHAVYEGLALESRLLLDAIETERGTPITRVTAMGGGSRSSTLLSIFADVLARDISVASEVETAALGAAMLAAFGVGLAGQGDLREIAARMSRTVETVAPGVENQQLYGDLFAVYRTIYPNLRDAFASLAAFR